MVEELLTFFDETAYAIKTRQKLINAMPGVASFLIGFTPIDFAKDATDFLAGKDVFTGEEMNRFVLALTIITPEIGDKLIKCGAKKVDEILAVIKRNSDDVGSVAKKSGMLFWGKWSDYEKVIVNEHEYAKIGDRLYSRHAVDRMQPSGNRYGSAITQAGGDYGRSVSPHYVEDVIARIEPVIQENGNLKYVGGSLIVITNKEGSVVTVITK